MNTEQRMVERKRKAPLGPPVAESTAEVWLLDSGQFLVCTDVHPSWRSDWRWLRRMRQRRVLRMYVPLGEVEKLPQIEVAFSAAKRGFEIRDVVAKGSRDALRAVQGLLLNFPSEAASAIKTRPYEPPKPVPMPTPEERAAMLKQAKPPKKAKA